MGKNNFKIVRDIRSGRKSLDALKTEYNIKVIAKNVQTFYLELGAGNGE